MTKTVFYLFVFNRKQVDIVTSVG